MCKQQDCISELAGQMQQLIGDEAEFFLTLAEIDQCVEHQFGEAKGERTGNDPHAAGMDDTVGGERHNPYLAAVRLAARLLAGQEIALQRVIRQSVHDHEGGKNGQRALFEEDVHGTWGGAGN